jgi:hypothetical protein
MDGTSTPARRGFRGGAFRLAEVSTRYARDFDPVTHYARMSRMLRGQRDARVGVVLMT